MVMLSRDAKEVQHEDKPTFKAGIIGISSETHEPVKVVAKWNGTRLTNALEIVQSAICGWGKVKTATEIPSSLGQVFHVESTQHGGYYLFAWGEKSAPFPLPMKPQEVWPIFTYGPFRPCDGHTFVYTFERDSEAALLEYFDEKVFAYQCARIKITPVEARANLRKQIERDFPEFKGHL